MSDIDLLPERVYFAEHPDISLLRPCLGLTLYLAPVPGWAEQYASELFGSFLDHIDPIALRAWVTSAVSHWRTIADIEDLRIQLESGSLLGRVRHLWRFSTADDTHAPGVGFTYREVDPRRAPPLGYVQIFLPFRTPPDELLALAIEIGQRFPIACGVGGYCFSTNRLYPRNSFYAAFRQAKRFIGVDVQEPEAMSWHAAHSLPTTGWLTLLGMTATAAGIDVEALAARNWKHDIGVLRLAHATLIRAGDAPRTGDVNLMSYPTAMAEVADALAPYFVKGLEMPGRFEEDARTDDWRHRLRAPDLWT